VRRAIVFLVVAGVLLVVGVGSASADTFAWSQSGDFTSSGGGSNPEHKFGEPSWSYSSSIAGAMTFSSNHWSDSGGGQIGPPISGELEMVPAAGNSVSLTWTSPFSQAKSVSASGVVSEPTPGVLCGFTWTLTNGASTVNNGSDVGGTTGNNTIANTLTVAPGATVKLTIADASAAGFYSSACDEALVQLTLQASGSASLTLNAPASEPVTTSTPTFGGTAATGPGDSSSVAVEVYPGSTASGTPVAFSSASVGASGQFSAPVAPPLPDGEYTAVAGQTGPTGMLTSAPVTFRVKANAPPVTLSEPAAGSQVGSSHTVFAGQAGNSADDSQQVTVLLYKGTGAQGTPLRQVTVNRTGATWSATWPTALALGRYTAQAQQTDDAGHTGVSQANTFEVVKESNVIGQAVHVSPGAVASVKVGCVAPAGATCSGDVRVLTLRSFSPSAGSPRGPLQVMFAYVTIPAGQTATIRRTVPSGVLGAMRHAHQVKVRVTATLTPSGGVPTTFSVVRALSGRL
jgi:Bacterial Ig-like domain